MDGVTAPNDMAFMASAAFRVMTKDAVLALARIVLTIAEGGDCVRDAEFISFGVHVRSIVPTMRELENLGTITALRRRDLKGYMIGMSQGWRDITTIEQARAIARAARGSR
jgi:hypothetical protein